MFIFFSQYYYNATTGQFMYWDGEKSTYLPAPSDQQQQQEAATQGMVKPTAGQPATTEKTGEEKTKKKEEKKEKVKIAKKIAKVSFVLHTAKF